MPFLAQKLFDDFKNAKLIHGASLSVQQMLWMWFTHVIMPVTVLLRAMTQCVEVTILNTFHPVMEDVHRALKMMVKW